ncbi:hypothetical protein CJ030_MR7G009299 [Morella rubra]|uniref:Uncharacterized protein n=1 Tax=Morella rubra TaxID=262757 RepID=A0A6A1V493_9ROSI|nr:hypothetical protein CJ030_MR7G009299 [Morella rubra]
MTKCMGRSQRGKQNRSLQTSLHTGGSRSFARHAYEMRRIEEILCNESATSQPSRQSRTKGIINWSLSDAFAQVLGPERHGRICGVGLGPLLHPSLPTRA